MTHDPTSDGAEWFWTDSHCHLQSGHLQPGHLQSGHLQPADRDATLQRMRAARVLRAICVGTDEDTSRRSIELASAQVHGVELFATCGIHPHDAADGVEGIVAVLDEFGDDAPAHRLVAVGECGLDYYYEHSPKDAQRAAFAAQIALAAQFDLALVVHTRDAWDDTFDLLSSQARPDRVVLHCFTGDAQQARRFLDLGAYLSFSGIVTFKNAGEIREAALVCPKDRLLVETDTPYLTPVPHRGSPNEPAYVHLVGEALATLRGQDPEVLARLTSANASEAFGLRP